MIEPGAKPVPILYVIHSLGHGGMERQMSAIVSRLDRSRFEPHVACVIEGFRADEMRRAGVPIIRIPIRSFWDPGPFALAKFLSEYIKQYGIKMVHLFDTGMGFVTALAARSVSGVRLLTSQRSFMGHIPRKHRLLLLYAHWRASAVVVNCNATKVHFHRVYHYPLRRIQICYNGVDTQVFQPAPRQRLDALRDAPLVIGCVCVFRPEKNLPQLVEVFARLREKVPGVKLLLMGSGPEEPAIRAAAASMGVSGDCYFLPSSADVTAAMRSIDIFVHPSLTESLPNAVMEAMASGCCVVATEVGGCSELIEHGVHGLLAKPGNTADLMKCVNSVMIDAALRARLAETASSRMLREFSLDRAVQRMERIYEEQLKSG
jgi:L-malate glycosyltransferase